MPLYVFRCIACGTLKEEFRSLQDRKLPAACDECEGSAAFTPSAPTIKLEGITGDFPTSYLKWERLHNEGTKIASKKAND